MGEGQPGIEGEQLWTQSMVRFSRLDGAELSGLAIDWTLCLNAPGGEGGSEFFSDSRTKLRGNSKISLDWIAGAHGTLNSVER
jgi:hypothetical protein